MEEGANGMEEFPVSAVEALCLGTSLTISGILYYVYRKKKKTVDKLKVSPGIKCNRMISHVIVSVEWFLTVFLIVPGGGLKLNVV